MTDETDETDNDGGVFTRETLSDVSVNAVPILILGALLIGFQVLTPGSGGEPLLAMHLALVAGVVLVSYVAARVITSEDMELQGPNGE